MGACFDSAELPPMPAAQVRDAFRRLAEDRAYERGHGPYSGSLGEKHGVMIRTDRVFPSRFAAETWLQNEFHDKWGPAGAVRFAPEAPKPSKRHGELEAKLAELRKELRDLPAGMIARAKAVKSKTRGCAACGSSIAVAWIGKQGDRFGHSHIHCPVCNSPDFLQTAADKTKRERLQAKITEAEAALKTEQAARDAQAVKGANPEKCPWVVGGWCSS